MQMVPLQIEALQIMLTITDKNHYRRLYSFEVYVTNVQKDFSFIHLNFADKSLLVPTSHVIRETRYFYGILQYYNTF